MTMLHLLFPQQNPTNLPFIPGGVKEARKMGIFDVR
jgi:hypothetical protein